MLSLHVFPVCIYKFNTCKWCFPMQISNRYNWMPGCIFTGVVFCWYLPKLWKFNKFLLTETTGKMFSVFSILVSEIQHIVHSFPTIVNNSVNKNASNKYCTLCCYLYLSKYFFTISVRLSHIVEILNFSTGPRVLCK